MSRPVDQKSHLRSRSSVTTRFGSQSSASSVSFDQKHRFSQVSDADRTKFQSFKFPSPTSSPRSSILLPSGGFAGGLPTPPPSRHDLQFFPDHELANPSPSSVEGTSPSFAPSLPSPQYQTQHQTPRDASVDLTPMESYVEEIYEEYGRDSEAGWSPYRWPSNSASSYNAGLMKSPYGGQFVTPSAGAGHHINTYRVKRGLIFRRGLPSSSIMRILLLGSWFAMIILIVLAVLFIVK